MADGDRIIRQGERDVRDAVRALERDSRPPRRRLLSFAIDVGARENPYAFAAYKVGEFFWHRHEENERRKRLKADIAAGLHGLTEVAQGSILNVIDAVQRVGDTSYALEAGLRDGIRPRVRVDASDALRKIAIIESSISDMRPFWPIVYRLVAGAGGWWPRQFETEGAFGGRRWAALSPDYARIKATMFPGKPILQASGRLRQAASRPRRAATAQSLTLAIDDPKLQFHQEGTKRMPARPLVFGDPLPAAAQRELEDAADRYVADLLRRF